MVKVAACTTLRTHTTKRESRPIREAVNPLPRVAGGGHSGAAPGLQLPSLVMQTCVSLWVTLCAGPMALACASTAIHPTGPQGADGRSHLLGGMRPVAPQRSDGVDGVPSWLLGVWEIDPRRGDCPPTVYPAPTVEFVGGGLLGNYSYWQSMSMTCIEPKIGLFVFPVTVCRDDVVHVWWPDRQCDSVSLRPSVSYRVLDDGTVLQDTGLGCSAYYVRSQAGERRGPISAPYPAGRATIDTHLCDGGATDEGSRPRD